MDREQGTATLGVALRSANLLKMSLVTTAAMLAIYLLAFAEATSLAEAASLPQNGKIVFDSNRNTPESVNAERDMEIFTMDPDGSDIEQLTDNGTDDSMPAFHLTASVSPSSVPGTATARFTP